MKQVAALSITALVLIASAFGTTFTEQSNQFCTYHAYVINGVNVDRYTCTVIPAAMSDGATTDQAFYADMTPNADDSGGTFAGQFYIDSYTVVSFSGGYTGPKTAPTGLTGTWDNGNVTIVFGTHIIGAGRYGPRTVRYLMAGSGSR